VAILSDPDQKLILDFIAKRIPEEDFLRRLEFRSEPGLPLPLSLLQRALLEKDADAVEFGSMLMYRLGITPDYLSILNALAEEPWHRTHEDIVFALGKIQDPASVDTLSRTAVAKYPYLDYDEAFALGTKSIYALWRIRTAEAVAKLGVLARNENEVLRTTARERLADLAEKGAPEIQALAKRQLEGLT